MTTEHHIRQTEIVESFQYTNNNRNNTQQTVLMTRSEIEPAPTAQFKWRSENMHTNCLNMSTSSVNDFHSLFSYSDEKCQPTPHGSLETAKMSFPPRARPVMLHVWLFVAHVVRG